MDNNNMNTIKFLKEERIELNGVVYKPYKICNLPPSFGEEILECKEIDSKNPNLREIL